MRLKLRVIASLSSSTAEELDLANVAPSSYEVCDELQEGSARTYKVATGVADQAIDLAGVTSAAFVYVRTNREITLSVNGQDVVVSVPDGFEYGHFLTTGAVSALAVSNSSGGTARVVVIIAGV